MSTSLRVLILEDHAADAERMLRELRAAGFAPQWQRVDTREDYLARLGPDLDLVLADYRLPRFDAIGAIHEIQRRGLDIPVIVVSGSVSEETALECMKQGAADCLLKDRLARLGPAVRQALDRLRLRREARTAEAALRESVARFRRLGDSAPDLIFRFRLRPTPRFEYVSPAATGITGYTPAEYYADSELGRKLVHPDEGSEAWPWPDGEPGPQPRVQRWRRKDGTSVWTEQRSVAIHDEAGHVIAIEGIVSDVTERQQAQETQALLAAIVESSNDAIVGTTRDGTIVAWNAAAERICGYSVTEARGRPASMLLPSGRIPELGGLLERLGRGERIEAWETAWVRKDGARIEVAVTLSPVWGTTGRISGISAIVRDITERRRVEEALRESEERFRSAFEDAATGMALQALDGRYLRVNAALCRMLGYSAEELLASGFHALTHPEDLTADADADRRMLGGEISSYQVEKRYLHKLGHPVWVLASVSLVRSRERQPLYFVVQAQDLTERRRAEEAEARLQAQLVQSEKRAAMGQLLAGVAHELNNPLAVALGQAVLLQHKATGGPLAARAEKIAEAAKRCARIVQNFLALARERPPERQHVSLNRVVREALELLAYGLRVDNVEVRLELASGLPELWADPHQLHQVVVNLVGNAHQALRQVASPRRLTLATGADEEQGSVWLEVVDTGPGIPPEIQPRIFEPFFTTRPPGQGSGLGLSLCQGIVESHGGRITVESGPGRGARFQIVLPVMAARTEGAALPRPTPAVGRRILVVEDEPEIAEMLADMLAEDGHSVDTAGNGMLALDRLAERGYDLVVSDLKMPGLDGAGLYREALRRYPDLRDRFVFLTGDTLYQDTVAFLAEAAAPLLSKPFSTDEALQVVREALRPDRAGVTG